nr:hypothetical protein [Fodinicola feengrottensis]
MQNIEAVGVFPVLVRRFEQPAAGGPAGVGNQQVQPSKVVSGGSYGRCQLFRICHVRGDAEQFAGLAQTLRVSAAHRHRDTLGDQSAGDGEADPAAAAGDEGGLAGEAQIHCPSSEVD